MNSTNIELGTLIKEYRLKKNFTQFELSQKLGYDTPQFVSIMERGLAKIPLNVIGQLIILLGIPEKKVMNILLEAYKKNLVKEISDGKTQAG